MMDYKSEIQELKRKMETLVKSVETILQIVQNTKRDLADPCNFDYEIGGKLTECTAPTCTKHNKKPTEPSGTVGFSKSVQKEQ
jgi:hypothetical protein